MKRALIINPFGIGDCLFTLPLINALKSEDPGIFVGFWCNERTEEILVKSAAIDKTYALSRGDLKRVFKTSRIKGVVKLFWILNSLRKEKFDTVLDFSLDHRYGFISKVLGIKTRVGFNFKNRGRFLTKKIDIDGYSSRHIVECYLDLLKLIDFPINKAEFELKFPQSDLSLADKLLQGIGLKKDEEFVAIAPAAGASWGKDAKFKHWPADKFALLIDRIYFDLGIKAVIFGDNSEVDLIKGMVKLTKSKPADLSGKTALGMLPALFKKAALLITNDGGPLHVASAVGTKTVSIFGPVDERVYGPYPVSERNIVITNDIACRPCYQKFKMSVCRIDKSCLNSISVNEVFEAVRKLI